MVHPVQVSKILQEYIVENLQFFFLQGGNGASHQQKENTCKNLQTMPDPRFQHHLLPPYPNPKLEIHHAMVPKWYLNQLKKENEKEGEKQTVLKFKSKQQAVSMKEGRLKAIAGFIVIENHVC